MTRKQRDKKGRVWTSDPFQDQALIDLASPSIYLSLNLCITTAQNGGFLLNIFTYAYHVLDTYSFLPYQLSTTSPASPSMPYAHTESYIPMYVCNLDASQERKHDICLCLAHCAYYAVLSLSLVSLVSLKVMRFCSSLGGTTPLLKEALCLKSVNCS